MFLECGEADEIEVRGCKKGDEVNVKVKQSGVDRGLEAFFVNCEYYRCSSYT